jgi:hypothetical protein
VTYNGLMPAFAQLGDAEIAALLNHVLTPGAMPRSSATPSCRTSPTTSPPSAAGAWTATDVLARRSELDLD